MSERVESVVDACERQLRDWIVRGKVSPGQRLPAERVLASRLGVDRTTLRSALTRLVSARLVRVRQGSGYVVQDVWRVAGLELLPALAGDEDRKLALVGIDLLRVRRALVMIALGDGRAPDLGLLERDVAHLQRLVEGGTPADDLAEGERQILAALFSSSRTPVLLLSFNSLWFAMRSMPRLHEAMYAAPEALLPVAAALVRWADEPTARAANAVLHAMDARDRVVGRLRSGTRRRRRTSTRD